MKPSLTPCFRVKSSWYLARRSRTADMSTSLKVVSMAASCWAWTRRWARRWRRGESLRRTWLEAPAGWADTVDCAPAGGFTGTPGERIDSDSAETEVTGFPVSGLPAEASAAAGLRFPTSWAASRSPLVTRPPLPLAATVAGSTPVSAARRRTAGEIESAGEGATPDAGFRIAVVDSVPPVSAVASIVATSWPIFTSLPAATFSAMRPAASAVASELILSVSSSKSG